ncbi:MAG: integration host factor subunit beta [Candidatus Cardinium sp.]|uniref:DNA-binding protein HU n=1 Tax=Candidatus Cardinium hertigii TaxID=247481 RepID=A0A2Z3LBR3_9BACT|nr:HU family DNA-binding protein [Candidatus Cardinium hertigii]AWN81632.1 DNA-binding protein HU [Candidatus Cardinium hertigii]MDD9139654.1 integration host factor subunit beta [Candidatus Cardinium sp.]
MTTAEVISTISRRNGVDKKDIRSTMDELWRVIQDSIADNQRVHFSGFGSFFKKKRAKKIGRNISTNTAIVVEEHFIPSFKPSKAFATKIKMMV